MTKTKIDIVSGFLGAGKTTFIKKLLEAVKDEQVVLIENEFGEIGIDGGFLKDAGIEIREMNSGCICCSLVGDFAASLKEILHSYQPDRIIIEPSGVGKLSDVQKAVTDVEAELGVESNCSVTLVDVKKCKMYMKNFGEFFNNQIAHAGTIVLSRTDVADEKKVDEALAMIREINPKAEVVTTPIAQLSAQKLLDSIEKQEDFQESLLEEYKQSRKQGHHHEHHEGCGCGEHGHHHEHHEGCGCGEHGHHHEHHEGCGCGEHGHHHEHHEGCGCGEHGHHHEHHEGCGCGEHGHHHHHAEEVFTSWGLENVPALRKEKLEEVLERFTETTEYGIILRAKGMVKDAESEDWFYFDMVPEESNIRKGEAESSGKICVIGVGLKEDKLYKEFKTE